MDKPVVLAALAATLAVAAAGWAVMDRGAPPGTAAAYVLHPDDPQLVTKGRAIYVAQCAACHGARLEGQADWRTRGADGLLPAPPHDASGHTWHHPDETLFRITKFGVAQIIGDPTYKSAMPAYGDRLSDEEIVAVLSWIKAQWPPSVRQQHDQMNAQATQPQRP